MLGSGDVVHRDSMLLQPLEYADVRKASRPTSTQDQTYLRPFRAWVDLTKERKGKARQECHHYAGENDNALHKANRLAAGSEVQSRVGMVIAFWQLDSTVNPVSRATKRVSARNNMGLSSPHRESEERKKGTKRLWVCY